MLYSEKHRTINTCKNLLVLKGKELEIPKKAVKISDYIILAIELVAFLFD